MSFSLRGTIRDDAGQPVPFAPLRLVAPKALLEGVTGARPAGAAGSIAWTRPLSGFASHRSACFDTFVHPDLPELTFNDFKEQVLTHNPDLISDGYGFKRNKLYLLPERAPTSIVLWDRPVSTLSSHRWAAWSSHVEGKVEGISWDEFKEEVVEHNPTLEQSGHIFQAGQSYLMPRSVPLGKTIAWTRRLSGFAGTRWECWESHLKGKLPGLLWDDFVEEVLARNPQLVADERRFESEKSYLIPESVSEISLFVLPAMSDEQGNFKLDGLQKGGSYSLSVEAAGHPTYRRRLRLSGARSHDVRLAKSAAQSLQQVRDKEPTPPPPAPDKSRFVQAQGGRFVLHDKPFRFVGANIRGLIHYGQDGDLRHEGKQRNDIMKSSHVGHREDQLNGADQLGARVIRTFIADRFATPAVIKRRLTDTLVLVEKHDMYLICVLTDVHEDTGLFPPGDEKFYTQGSSPEKLNLQWYREGYKENYKDYAKEIVSHFKANPRILAWEIGNELKAWEGSNEHPAFRVDDFIRFTSDMSTLIREWDPNHLIGSGIINTGNLGATPAQREQIARLPNLDYLTAHVYYNSGGDDEVRRAPQEADLAKKVGKPFIVEEFGVEHGDLVEQTRHWLEQWLLHYKADGVLQWGFMAIDDMGDGDNQRGLDPKARGADTYQKTVATFKQARSKYLA